MKVYVITTNQGVEKVCANHQLARSQMYKMASSRGLDTNHLSVTRINKQNLFVEEYHHKAPDNKEVIYKITCLDVEGNLVLDALTDIRKEIDRIPKGYPDSYYNYDKHEEEEEDEDE